MASSSAIRCSSSLFTRFSSAINRPFSIAVAADRASASSLAISCLRGTADLRPIGADRGERLVADRHHHRTADEGLAIASSGTRGSASISGITAVWPFSIAQPDAQVLAGSAAPPTAARLHPRRHNGIARRRSTMAMPPPTIARAVPRSTSITSSCDRVPASCSIVSVRQGTSAHRHRRNPGWGWKKKNHNLGRRPYTTTVERNETSG